MRVFGATLVTQTFHDLKLKIHIGLIQDSDLYLGHSVIGIYAVEVYNG